MELRGELNAKNDVDLFFLQFVYLPSWAIGEFAASYNCHSLSSEKNATPLQLLWANQSLIELHHGHTTCCIDEQGLEQLKCTINPLAQSNNKVFCI